MLRRNTEDNYQKKSGKNSKLLQTFVVLSVTMTVLFFISVTPFSYADTISTILVGSNPYGITYGTSYGNGNIYATNLSSNTVSVISDTTNSVVATIPVGTSPYGVAYGSERA